MTRVLAVPITGHTSTPSAGPASFFAGALVLVACSALLAGWAPIGFSVATVFLFAGPHNWMEGRYFLQRMPARWGALRWFFLTGLAGVAGLTLLFAGMPRLVEASGRGAD